jgi:hypothetical protein
MFGSGKISIIYTMTKNKAIRPFSIERGFSSSGWVAKIL